MAELLERLIGTTTSTFTPLGCVRNCVMLILTGFFLYEVLVIIFIFVQGGF